MTLNTLTPNLMVENVEETIEWYERVLDTETVDTVPDDEGQLQWVLVAIDDVSLMVQRRESLEGDYPPLAGAAIGGSLTFYIDVDDADELHDRLAATDAEIVNELHDTDYGRREFAIEDYNGYVLWFGAVLTQ